MNRASIFLSSIVLAASVVACGSGGDSTATADGGVTPQHSATSAACVVAINGFEPQCQLYEASGADAARVIAQLRAACTDRQGAKQHLVDGCSANRTLGGCKTPVKVQGASDVKLFTTVFEYAPTGDAGAFAPKTPAAFERLCKSQGADAVYVDSP